MANTLSQNSNPNNGGYIIHFSSIPPIGTRLEYFKDEIELVEVKDYIRKDGTPSALLIWQRSDGVKGASGLSSKSLSYPEWLS